MTKEEIVKRELSGEELEMFGNKMGNLFDCMDEFAKQRSIEYHKWLWENNYMHAFKEEPMYYKIDDKKPKGQQLEYFTPDQCYNLFLEHLKQQSK